MSMICIHTYMHQIRSDQISRSVVSDSLRSHELQHARPPCLSPTPGTCSLMSVKPVMPSNHHVLCHHLLLPTFNLSQHQDLFQ